MGKNVEEVRNEEVMDKAVADVQETAEDLENKVTPKWYQKINWKRIGKDTVIFVAGVVAKTVFDCVTGKTVDVPAIETTAVPEIDTTNVADL